MTTYWSEFTVAEIEQIEAHIERSQREGVYDGIASTVKRDTRIMNELMRRRSSKQRPVE